MPLNYFCCILLFALSAILNPARPDTETGAATGISRKSNGLIQDKTGKLWLCDGSKAGLTVYDGKTFTQYTTKDGLGCDFVWCALEDHAGKIWLGTADGISCYDGKNFSTIPITAITGDTAYHKTEPDDFGFPQPVQNWVNCILEDRDGIFWIGTANGVYRYDGKKFSHFTHDDNVENNTGDAIGMTESIFQDKDGNIWFGGRGTEGVFCYDGKTLQNFKPRGNNWLYPILQDKTGIIWFSAPAAGLYKYNGKDFEFFGKGEFSDFFFAMTEDDSGNFWFGNGKNGGVSFYDGKRFVNYTPVNGVCDEHMRKMTKDKDGNIWFSCRNQGLCKYDGKNFACYGR